jgi:hypothetical protein
MTQRITRKFLEARFAMAMQSIGAVHGGPYVKTDTGYEPVANCCFIDHNSVYGGYVIMQMAETGTGQSHPFGDERMGAQEFSRHLGTIMRTAAFLKQGQN